MTGFRKSVTAAVSLVAAAAVIFIYRNHDPAETSWFPRCPSKLLTGYDCPGCGSQRALHALLNGDVGGVVSHNALLLPALVMIALIGAGNAIRERDNRLYRALTGSTACYITLGVIVVWTVVRNIFGW